MNIEEAIRNLKELISWKEQKIEVRDYEIESIETLLTAYEKEKEKNKELEFALLDMVFQFADRPKIEGCHYGLATMGLSALENAFNVLDFDEVEPIVRAEKRYNELLEWRSSNVK